MQYMPGASAAGPSSAGPSHASALPLPSDNPTFNPDPRLQRRLDRISNPAVKNSAQALLLGKGKHVDSRAAAIKDFTNALADLPINDDPGPRRQREYALEGLAGKLAKPEGDLELQAMRLLTCYLSPESIPDGFKLPDHVRQHLAQNGSPQQIASEASRVNILGSLLSGNASLSPDARCQAILMTMRNVEDPGKIADVDARAELLATALERWLHVRPTEDVDLNANPSAMAVERSIRQCVTEFIHLADIQSDDGLHSSPELDRLRKQVLLTWKTDAQERPDGHPPGIDAGIRTSVDSNGTSVDSNDYAAPGRGPAFRRYASSDRS